MRYQYCSVPNLMPTFQLLCAITSYKFCRVRAKKSRCPFSVAACTENISWIRRYIKAFYSSVLTLYLQKCLKSSLHYLSSEQRYSLWCDQQWSYANRGYNIRTLYNRAHLRLPHTGAPKLCLGFSWPYVLPRAQALCCYINCYQCLNSLSAF